MNVLGQSTAPQVQSGCGMVCGEVRVVDADLAIDQDALRDVAVRGLIDDWLVPVITESLLRDLVSAELE